MASRNLPSAESSEQAFITAQVPADLKEQVEAIAARDERPVSWVVRHALKRYVADFEKDAAA